MKNSYSIGEFSQITGLSVKTLRFYHEQGLLTPSFVDPATGYRFYDASKIEKTRVIMRLRAMEFSIEDISAVLSTCDDESDILNYLELQKSALQQRIHEDRDIVRSFDEIIAREKSANIPGVSIRSLPAARCVTLVHRGPYDQLGRSYAKIVKHLHDNDLKINLPSREVYLKGPGMIFKGNSNNYLTEIQLPIAA